VRVGSDGDLNAGLAGQPGIFRRQIDPVGAGVDFEQAAIGSRLLDDPLDVDFIARTFEEQAAGGVTEDREIAIVLALSKPNLEWIEHTV
jgi:hypothetical protein